MARINEHRPAQSDEATAFSWPGRSRSEELERAAARAARQGLERLRSRQVRLAGPVPAAPTPELDPDPGPAPDEAEALADEPPAAEAPAEQQGDDPAPAPDPWESEFDDLADTLIDQLRRDLGPEKA